MIMSQVYRAHKLIKSLSYSEALPVNYLGVIYKGKKGLSTKPMIFLGGHMRLMEL